jgi:hypothetical protein
MWYSNLFKDSPRGLKFSGDVAGIDATILLFSGSLGRMGNIQQEFSGWGRRLPPSEEKVAENVKLFTLECGWKQFSVKRKGNILGVNIFARFRKQERIRAEQRRNRWTLA